MKKLTCLSVIWMAAMTIFTGCSSEETENLQEPKCLEISVGTETMETRALVESSSFASGAKIGVTLEKGDGTDYEDKSTYKNMLYTAKGEGSVQTWEGAQALLSTNEAHVYAYYPYKDNTNISSIPVTTDNCTDYMWATPVTGVSHSNATANLTMNHALAAVRVTVKRGTYIGTGNVTAVTMKSEGSATSAKLNAKDGTLSDINGANDTRTLTVPFTLSSGGTTQDLTVIPTGATNKPFVFNVTVDGVQFVATSTDVTVTPGYIYQYEITVDANALSLSKVSIGEWGYDNLGNPVVDLGYKVTITGDMSDIAIQNSVSNGVLTVKAVALSEGYVVKEATSTGTATISQSSSGSVRTITVSGLKSDMTLTFSGTIKPLTWATATNGVYAVNAAGNPVAVADVVESEKPNYKGVALVSGTHKFMIQRDFTTTKYVWCGSAAYGTDQSGIPNCGSSTDAKADFNGKAHSAVLATLTDKGEYSYETIGQYMSWYNAGTIDGSTAAKNGGFTDWYIPAAGQLYLIYQNKTAINAALEAIGGNQLNTPNSYWSSSEYDGSLAWYVNLDFGNVSLGYKNSSNFYCVLCRDI